MRIVIANWTSRHVGGIETYVGRVADRLAAIGHDVFFVHEHDVPAERPPIGGMHRFPSASPERDGAKGVVQALAVWKPDVIFVQRLDDPEFEQLVIARTPAVFFAHDYAGLCISGFRSHRTRGDRVCHQQFDARCLLRFLPYGCGGRSPLTMWRDYQRQSARLHRLRGYHGIACFSEFMRQLFVRQGFSESSVHRLSPLEGTLEASVGSSQTNHGGVQLLFMGRIDRVKGCHLLIDALPLVAELTAVEVSLSVAGSGPHEDTCRRQAAEVMRRSPNVKVDFLGWQTPDACTRLLRESDVLVMPSTWPEPLGLAGLEALDAGVPVAAFAVGAIPEWLNDGVCGALAPASPPTASGLAAAIARCIQSGEMRAGALARAHEQRARSPHVIELSRVFEGAAGVRA